MDFVTKLVHTMLYPFFEQAARSPSRQKTFRQLLVVQLVVFASIIFIQAFTRARLLEMLGQAMLLSGIVLGALMIGWRLSQFPKSKFLEPLLLTPVSAFRVMIGEQLVGLTLFGFLYLALAPILLLLWRLGWVEGGDAILLTAHGFLWGAVTGLGLAMWAYEPLTVRQWGTRLSLAGLLLYLVIGGLMGEQTFSMLTALPGRTGFFIRDAFFYLHFNNPFSLVHALSQQNSPGLLERFLWVDGIGLLVGFAFAVRGCIRLKAHYLDRHYRPIADVSQQNRGTISERPMNWWAVRRVSEYSGQINLYLAFGASLLYASRLLLAENWPSWAGDHVFIIFERLGGVPVFCTVLFLLAGVPFAYQYGLWDSSIAERCRKLELFLLTQFNVRDYVLASAAASWHRGRGYVWASLLLAVAGWSAGRFYFINGLLGLLLGAAMIFLYFSISFQRFAKNSGGTSLGFVLTVGLPLVTWALTSANMEWTARLLPPGAVFFAFKDWSWQSLGLVSIILLACFVGGVVFLRSAMKTFDTDLRRWYDANSGKHS